MTDTKPQLHHALGIDFGTSNSYFSDVKVGGLELSHTDLKFHNGQSSVPTCILYKKKEEEGSVVWEPCCFGEAAIEEWKDLLEEEREFYRFRGGFKPDITFDEQAYRDAVHFFRCAKEYLLEQRVITHFTPASGRQVVVGVPARNVQGQEEKTLQALEEAGLYDAVLIPEPEGALFYHLYFDKDRITVEKAHKGVIVIDFGGGTFDVAFLQDGVVRHHWGNPMLGGRLFDDLFYQWFLSMQGGENARREMIEDGSLDYLRTFGFRRLKERFSGAWSSGRLARFRERITVGADFDYGVFRGATLEAFFERARHYKASEDLLNDLELLDDPTVSLLRAGEVDLLALIEEQCSLVHLSSEEREQVTVTATVLTGGSCRWPFMIETIQRAFPEAECFQSPDPEATISRGLALCFAFREYSKEVSTQLKTHQSELEEGVFKAIEGAYQTFASRVSERFTSELYSGIIRPIFSDWRDKGGTVSALEEATQEAAKQYFNGPGKQVIEKERVFLQERIEQEVNNKLFAWLRQHRVTHVEYLSLSHFQQLQNDELQIDSQMSGVLDGFFETIKVVISTMIGMIVASLLGGGGVALLMSGPIGWLIGLILGVAATYATLKNVDTKQINIPSFLLKTAASDERLEKAQDSFKTEMKDAFLAIFKENELVLKEELATSIHTLVSRLSQEIPVTAVMYSGDSSTRKAR